MCLCAFVLMAQLKASAQEVLANEEKERMAKALAHYTLGLIQDWMGDSDEAIIEFEQSVAFDGERFSSHLRLGADYARVGKFPGAIEQLKKASQLETKDLQSHYLLALIYSTQNEFEKAASEYELILKQFSAADPQNIDIYGYLGQLYYSQKKYDKAIEQFQMILKLEPQNAEVMYLLGSLYLDVNDRKSAMEFFRKAIEIDPEHDGSLNSLSYMYAEDGVNLDEASELIQRALKISPDNGAYLDSLGWIYFKKGMYSEALESLKKADNLLKDPVIYEHLGDVNYQLNQMEEAQRNWSLSLELLPDQKTVADKLNHLKSQQANTKLSPIPQVK